MGHERWFRGQHDGQGRPFDWRAQARQHGIPEQRARTLYEQAVQQARGASAGRVQELYLALLADARPDTRRPAPGKVTRTMRLEARRTGKKRPAAISSLTGQPVTPGKVTLTSYLAPRERGPAVQVRPSESRDEHLAMDAMAELLRSYGLPALAAEDNPTDHALHTALAHRLDGAAQTLDDLPWTMEGMSEEAWADDATGEEAWVSEHDADEPRAGAEAGDEPWVDAELARPPEPLPEALRARMERAFGQRFDHVRIHRDSPVPAGRQAFTRGGDIHLGADAFDPESPESERILAHELAHVAQQARPAISWEPRPTIADLEADAHHASLQALAGQAAAVRLAAPAGLALNYTDDLGQVDGNAQRHAPRGTPGGAPPNRAPAARAETPAARPGSEPLAARGPGAGQAPAREPGAGRGAGTAPAGARPGAAPGGPAGGPATGAPGSAGSARGASGSSAGSPAGGGELILREAPDTLSAPAQARLGQIDGNIQGAAERVNELPAADASTTAARGAVEEPQAEQDANAQAGVARDIDDRPPPSPEIEAACERIREVIRSKRPPDEESLVDARPREMADQAGTEMNSGIESRADSVREGYSDMENAPPGQPSREAVPVELPPEQVDIPEIDAASGVPDELSSEDVSLEADLSAQRQRIEDAGMTSEAAELVQDGPIAEARTGLGDLETMAAADPAQVLADQSAAIERAAGDMQALQAAAEQALAQARSSTVGTLGTRSDEITGSEEQQRAEAGRRMQAIFDRARTDVDGLLQPLSGAALGRWDAGVDRLASDFESSLASVKQRIEERYRTEDDGNPLDEIGAGLTWLGDQAFGLPDWVVEEYDRAEHLFAEGCTTLITDISRDVNAVIEDCQAIIQQARDDIDAIVTSLPEELQAWAQGEAARLGTELDALESQVTETQQGLNQDLIDRSNAAVQEVRERVHELREAAKGVVGRIADAVAAFLEDPARFLIDGLLRVLGIPPSNFWALVDQLGNVIQGIADDPMGFANNLMAGVGQGFQQFFGNFPAHIGQSLFAWLFSRMGEAGVTMPRDFSIPSIVSLVLDVMGINWQRIRMLLARHIGEQNVAHIEQAYDIIRTFIAQGPLGLVELLREQLDPASIVDMIREAAIRYLMESIVTRVAARILMMLNPAGAILQAIEAIYRVLTWIYENAARIFTLIEAVVNGAAQVLAGNVGGLAALVEHALVGLMVPVIDFLADYLGLGGIPAAIRDLVLGLQQRVEQILDRVIGFIAEKARTLLGAMGMGGQGGRDGANQDSVLGEEVRFTADGEGHRLWVATQGNEARIMVASEPKPVEEQLRAWQPRVEQLSDEPDPQRQNQIPRQRVRALMAQAAGMAGVADDLADSLLRQGQSAETPPDDQQLEDKERSLASILRELFEWFGEDNPTLTHPVYELMGKQLVARGTPPAKDRQLVGAPADYHYRSSEDSGYIWIQRNNGARERTRGQRNGPAPVVHLDEQGILREGAGSAGAQDLGWLAREDVKKLLSDEAAKIAGQPHWVAMFATAGIKLRAAPGADAEALTLGKIWAKQPPARARAMATVSESLMRAMTLTNHDNTQTAQLGRPAHLDNPERWPEIARRAAAELLSRIENRPLYLITPTEIPRSMNVAELVAQNPLYAGDPKKLTGALYPQIASGIKDELPSTLDREIHHVLPLYLGGDHSSHNLERVIGQAADSASVHYLMHQMINQSEVAFYLNGEIVESRLSYTELAQAIPKAVRKIVLGTLHLDGKIDYKEHTKPAVAPQGGDA